MENKKSMSDMEQKAKLNVLSNLRDTARKAMGSKLGKKEESMAPSLKELKPEDNQEEKHEMEDCSPEEIEQEIEALMALKAKKLSENKQEE